jgi:hypothetical protein
LRLQLEERCSAFRLPLKKSCGIVVRVLRRTLEKGP